MQQAVNDLFVSSAVGGLSENLMLLLRFVKLNRKSPVLHPNQQTDFVCFSREVVNEVNEAKGKIIS